MLLQHRFVGESVISGADSLYDIALSEVGSFEELPGMHYVIPPGFESVIDILRDNVPPSSVCLQHVVTNISWNNSDLCKPTLLSLCGPFHDFLASASSNSFLVKRLLHSTPQMTRPRLRMIEAARGNGYAPVRGLPM